MGVALQFGVGMKKVRKARTFSQRQKKSFQYYVNPLIFIWCIDWKNNGKIGFGNNSSRRSDLPRQTINCGSVL